MNKTSLIIYPRGQTQGKRIHILRSGVPQDPENKAN